VAAAAAAAVAANANAFALRRVWARGEACVSVPRGCSIASGCAMGRRSATPLALALCGGMSMQYRVQ
jgi:hypothetical protein